MRFYNKNKEKAFIEKYYHKKVKISNRTKSFLIGYNYEENVVIVEKYLGNFLIKDLIKSNNYNIEDNFYLLANKYSFEEIMKLNEL